MHNFSEYQDSKTNTQMYVSPDSQKNFINEVLCSSLSKSKKFMLFSFLFFLKKSIFFQVHGGGKTSIPGFGNLFGELYFWECYFFWHDRDHSGNAITTLITYLCEEQIP